MWLESLEKMRPLSLRQTQVLQYLANGLSPKETAAILGISCSSVKTYIKRAGKKLSQSDVIPIILAATQLGLIVSCHNLDDTTTGNKRPIL
jgi:DNA-binding NarL/FixJ family response regulator